jgi:uncharacterized protein YecE (DUF72 family)
VAGRIRIGTAGWAYDDWKGIVYPESPPPGFHPLALLAGWFDLVELNVTFYRPATAAMARSWLDRVADRPDFRFTAKLHQRFTHEGGWGEGHVAEFRRGVDPLHDAGKLGALLLQFPWSLRPSPESLEGIERLVRAFRDYPLVVEVRHAGWGTEDFREWLAEREVGFCNVDMPSARGSLPLTAHATSPVGYLRLHGRNSRAWFDRDAGRDEKYDYTYPSRELDELEGAALRVSRHAEETHVVANNHYRGQAAATALLLRRRLLGETPEVPERLAKAYPELRDACRVTGQRELFDP